LLADAARLDPGGPRVDPGTLEDDDPGASAAQLSGDRKPDHAGADDSDIGSPISHRAQL
jgi:hypothetical protein